MRPTVPEILRGLCRSRSPSTRKETFAESLARKQRLFAWASVAGQLKTALAVQDSIDRMFGDFGHDREEELSELRRFLDAMEGALLEDTGLTVRVVLNVLVHAIAMHARLRMVAALCLPALLLSASLEFIALGLGLTANILWAPTSLLRALALLATLAPWIGLISWSIERRRAVERALPGSPGLTHRPSRVGVCSSTSPAPRGS